MCVFKHSYYERTWLKLLTQHFSMMFVHIIGQLFESTAKVTYDTFNSIYFLEFLSHFSHTRFPYRIVENSTLTKCIIIIMIREINFLWKFIQTEISGKTNRTYSSFTNVCLWQLGYSVTIRFFSRCHTRAQLFSWICCALNCALRARYNYNDLLSHSISPVLVFYADARQVVFCNMFDCDMLFDTMRTSKDKSWQAHPNPFFIFHFFQTVGFCLHNSHENCPYKTCIYIHKYFIDSLDAQWLKRLYCVSSSWSKSLLSINNGIACARLHRKPVLW